jgi:tRNA(adenine34) deaminase
MEIMAGAVERDESFMQLALEAARSAAGEDEVPVGAVLVRGGLVIASDHNRSIECNDPTAHAEIMVLRRAGQLLRNYRLVKTILYVTAEPCPMCVAAMVHARISRLVFGTREPKFGAIESRFKLLDNGAFNHSFEVTGGILEKECSGLLKDFFREKRVRKKEIRRAQAGGGGTK